jgi:hypothetical protein
LQVRKELYFSERSLYYPFDKFCSHYNEQGAMETDKYGNPDRYSSLRPVYSLNILGYNHFTEDEDALRIFSLYDKEREKAFGKELIKVGYFELYKTNIETDNQRY